jgi:hypothetical protein
MRLNLLLLACIVGVAALLCRPPNQARRLAIPPPGMVLVGEHEVLFGPGSYTREQMQRAIKQALED